MSKARLINLYFVWICIIQFSNLFNSDIRHLVLYSFSIYLRDPPPIDPSDCVIGNIFCMRGNENKYEGLRNRVVVYQYCIVDESIDFFHNPMCYEDFNLYPALV